MILLGALPCFALCLLGLHACYRNLPRCKLYFPVSQLPFGLLARPSGPSAPLPPLPKTAHLIPSHRLLLQTPPELFLHYFNHLTRSSVSLVLSSASTVVTRLQHSSLTSEPLFGSLRLYDCLRPVPANSSCFDRPAQPPTHRIIPPQPTDIIHLSPSSL